MEQRVQTWLMLFAACQEGLDLLRRPYLHLLAGAFWSLDARSRIESQEAPVHRLSESQFDDAQDHEDQGRAAVCGQQRQEKAFDVEGTESAEGEGGQPGRQQVEAHDTFVITPGLLADVVTLDGQPFAQERTEGQDVRVADLQWDRIFLAPGAGVLVEPGLGLLLVVEGADESSELAVGVLAEGEGGDPAVAALLQAALTVSSFGHDLPLSARPRGGEQLEEGEVLRRWLPIMEKPPQVPEEGVGRLGCVRWRWWRRYSRSRVVAR